MSIHDWYNKATRRDGDKPSGSTSATAQDLIDNEINRIFALVTSEGNAVNLGPSLRYLDCHNSLLMPKIETEDRDQNLDRRLDIVRGAIRLIIAKNGTGAFAGLNDGEICGEIFKQLVRMHNAAKLGCNSGPRSALSTMSYKDKPWEVPR